MPALPQDASVEQGLAKARPVVRTVDCAASPEERRQKACSSLWHGNNWSCQHLQANFGGHRAGTAQKEKREESCLF